jgi:hypothetical protein
VTDLTQNQRALRDAAARGDLPTHRRHGHTCPRCGHSWWHDPDACRGEGATFKSCEDAHRCSRCGEVQREPDLSICDRDPAHVPAVPALPDPPLGALPRAGSDPDAPLPAASEAAEWAALEGEHGPGGWCQLGRAEVVRGGRRLARVDAVLAGGERAVTYFARPSSASPADPPVGGVLRSLALLTLGAGLGSAGTAALLWAEENSDQRRDPRLGAAEHSGHRREELRLVAQHTAVFPSAPNAAPGTDANHSPGTLRAGAEVRVLERAAAQDGAPMARVRVLNGDVAWEGAGTRAALGALLPGVGTAVAAAAGHPGDVPGPWWVDERALGGPPPPVEPPPGEVVAGLTPVPHEGRDAYLWRGRWHYREQGGRWGHYAEEPAPLRAWRLAHAETARAAPEREGHRGPRDHRLGGAPAVHASVSGCMLLGAAPHFRSMCEALAAVRKHRATTGPDSDVTVELLGTIDPKDLDGVDPESVTVVGHRPGARLDDFWAVMRAARQLGLRAPVRSLDPAAPVPVDLAEASPGPRPETRDLVWSKESDGTWTARHSGEVVNRGVVVADPPLGAASAANFDPVTWVEVPAPGGYRVKVTGDVLRRGGVPVPMSFRDSVSAARALNAIPPTRALSDAALAAAKRAGSAVVMPVANSPDPGRPGAHPVGTDLGDQQAAAYAAAYPAPLPAGSGVLRYGGHKDMVLDPSGQPGPSGGRSELRESGPGSMVLYGGLRADGSPWQRGVKSDHDDRWRDYSQPVQLFHRDAVGPSGEPADLLALVAAGGPLGGPLPGWLAARLGGGAPAPAGSRPAVAAAPPSPAPGEGGLLERAGAAVRGLWS